MVAQVIAVSATCVHQGCTEQPQARKLILEASFRVEPAHLLVGTWALQPKHTLQGVVPGAWILWSSELPLLHLQKSFIAVFRLSFYWLIRGWESLRAIFRILPTIKVWNSCDENEKFFGKHMGMPEQMWSHTISQGEAHVEGYYSLWN